MNFHRENMFSLGTIADMRWFDKYTTLQSQKCRKIPKIVLLRLNRYTCIDVKNVFN